MESIVFREIHRHCSEKEQMSSDKVKIFPIQYKSPYQVVNRCVPEDYYPTIQSSLVKYLIQETGNVLLVDRYELFHKLLSCGLECDGRTSYTFVEFIHGYLLRRFKRCGVVNFPVYKSKNWECYELKRLKILKILATSNTVINY